MKFTEMKNMYEYIKKMDAEHKSKEWVAFSDSFNTLMRNMEKYMVPDQRTRNIAKLDAAGHKKINELFDKTVKATNDFLNANKNPKNDIEETRKLLVENLNNEFLSKAYVEFKNVKPNSKETLSDAMENVRNKGVDITGQKTSTMGGNMSSRMKMEFKEGTETKKGFFTKSTYFNPQEGYDKLISNMTTKYPEYKDFFNNLQGNQSVEETLEGWKPDGFAYMKDIGDIDYDSAIDQINEGVVNDKAKEQYEKFKDEPGFIYACYDFARQSVPVYTNLVVNREALQISEKDNIDIRNSAMSGVASLFGEDKLLAKSTNLKVKDGNNVIQGTFMENAKGKDINHLADDDPMYVYDEKVYDQPEVKKQLADLQIIDYICGNVDRHGGNMFYQFDTKDPKNPKLVGIQGIDNDASFMKKVPGVNEPVRLMGSINDMKVIDEDMAKKVMQLNEGMLKATLIGYGLKKEEVDASWERTKTLQEAIKQAQTYDKKKGLPPETDDPDAKPQIQIVPKGEWKNLPLKDLSGNLSTNIFKTVHNIPNTITSQRQPDPEMAKDVLVANQALENSVIRTDKELGEFYKDAKNAKNLFGTSKRYKDVLDKLDNMKDDSKKSKEANEEKMYQDKLKKLGELKQLVDKYKKEKQEDGTIDKDGNLLVNLTGKDKARVDIINKLDKYIEDKTNTLNAHAFARQEVLDKQEKDKESCAKTNEFQEKHRANTAEKTSEKSNDKPEIEKISVDLDDEVTNDVKVTDMIPKTKTAQKTHDKGFDK